MGWGWGGVFLSFGRPTQEQQKSCLAAAGGFNYDAALHGASRPRGKGCEESSSSSKGGFVVNRSRVLMGSGAGTFEQAKSGLLSWRHLALGWAEVQTETPVKEETRFCICYKEVIPFINCWVMLPLQIAYVLDDSSSNSTSPTSSKSKKNMFAFGCGTLQGHLLAGEERFSVQLDSDDRVWYEVFSFSKPAHPLAALCYPYVRLRQRHFAHHSAKALLNHVLALQDAHQSTTTTSTPTPSH